LTETVFPARSRWREESHGEYVEAVQQRDA
jgi:hypothetical protein